MSENRAALFCFACIWTAIWLPLLLMGWWA